MLNIFPKQGRVNCVGSTPLSILLILGLTNMPLPPPLRFFPVCVPSSFDTCNFQYPQPLSSITHIPAKNKTKTKTFDEFCLQIIYLLWPIFVFYPLTHWIRGKGWLHGFFGIVDQSGSLTVHASTGNQHILNSGMRGGAVGGKHLSKQFYTFKFP